MVYSIYDGSVEIITFSLELYHIAAICDICIKQQIKS